MEIQHDMLREILQRPDDTSSGIATPLTSVSYHKAIQDIRGLLDVLNSTAAHIPLENEIFRALYFPDLFRRDDTIASAVGDTYRWLLENENSRYSQKAKTSGPEYDSNPGEESPTVFFLLKNVISRKKTKLISKIMHSRNVLTVPSFLCPAVQETAPSSRYTSWRYHSEWTSCRAP